MPPDPHHRQPPASSSQNQPQTDPPPLPQDHITQPIGAAGDAYIPLNESQIHNWFIHQNSWRRIKLLIDLLHTCHPVELRFVLTVAQDMASPHENSLKGLTMSINQPKSLDRKLKRKHQLLLNQLREAKQYFPETPVDQQPPPAAAHTGSLLQQQYLNGVSVPMTDTASGRQAAHPAQPPIYRAGNAAPEVQNAMYQPLAEGVYRPFVGPMPQPAPYPQQFSYVPQPYHPYYADQLWLHNHRAQISARLRQLDIQLRYELFMSLALLKGDAVQETTKVIFAYVSDYIDRKINASRFRQTDAKQWYTFMRQQYSQEDIVDFLLLTTMVVQHPAFKVKQKESLFIKYRVLESFHDDIQATLQRQRHAVHRQQPQPGRESAFETVQTGRAGLLKKKPVASVRPLGRSRASDLPPQPDFPLNKKLPSNRSSTRVSPTPLLPLPENQHILFDNDGYRPGGSLLMTGTGACHGNLAASSSTSLINSQGNSRKSSPTNLPPSAGSGEKRRTPSAASAISPVICYNTSPESSPENKTAVDTKEAVKVDTRDAVVQTSPPVSEIGDDVSEVGDGETVPQSCPDLPPDSAVLHVRSSSTSLAYFSQLPLSNKPSDGSLPTKESPPTSTSSQYHDAESKTIVQETVSRGIDSSLEQRLPGAKEQTESKASDNIESSKSSVSPISQEITLNSEQNSTPNKEAIPLTDFRVLIDESPVHSPEKSKQDEGQLPKRSLPPQLEQVFKSGMLNSTKRPGKVSGAKGKSKGNKKGKHTTEAIHQMVPGVMSKTNSSYPSIRSSVYSMGSSVPSNRDSPTPVRLLDRAIYVPPSSPPNHSGTETSSFKMEVVADSTAQSTESSEPKKQTTKEPNKNIESVNNNNNNTDITKPNAAGMPKSFTSDAIVGGGMSGTEFMNAMSRAVSLGHRELQSKNTYDNYRTKRLRRSTQPFVLKAAFANRDSTKPAEREVGPVFQIHFTWVRPVPGQSSAIFHTTVKKSITDLRIFHIQLSRVIKHQRRKVEEKLRDLSSLAPVGINALLLPQWPIEAVESWTELLDKTLNEIIKICWPPGKDEPPPYIVPEDKKHRLDVCMGDYVSMFVSKGEGKNRKFCPAEFLFECEEFPMDFFENDSEITRLNIKEKEAYSSSEVSYRTATEISNGSQVDQRSEVGAGSVCSKRSQPKSQKSSQLDEVIEQCQASETSVEVDEQRSESGSSTVSDERNDADDSEHDLSIQSRSRTDTRDSIENVPGSSVSPNHELAMYHFLQDLGMTKFYIEQKSVREILPATLCDMSMVDFRNFVRCFSITKDELTALYVGLKSYARFHKVPWKLKPRRRDDSEKAKKNVHRKLFVTGEEESIPEPSQPNPGEASVSTARADSEVPPSGQEAAPSITNLPLNFGAMHAHFLLQNANPVAHGPSRPGLRPRSKSAIITRPNKWSSGLFSPPMYTGGRYKYTPASSQPSQWGPRSKTDYPGMHPIPHQRYHTAGRVQRSAVPKFPTFIPLNGQICTETASGILVPATELKGNVVSGSPDATVVYNNDVPIHCQQQIMSPLPTPMTQTSPSPQPTVPPKSPSESLFRTDTNNNYTAGDDHRKHNGRRKRYDQNARRNGGAKRDANASTN